VYVYGGITTELSVQLDPIEGVCVCVCVCVCACVQHLSQKGNRIPNNSYFCCENWDISISAISPFFLKFLQILFFWSEKIMIL
jgi:hypothetical protein